MNAEIRLAANYTEFPTPEGCWILEVANDPGDETVSIARARVPGGTTTEWHRLRDIEERYIIVTGHGRVEVGDIPACAVGPGDVVRIPANTPQRIVNTEQTDLIFYCVCNPRFKVEAYVSDQDEARNR